MEVPLGWYDMAAEGNEGTSLTNTQGGVRWAERTACVYNSSEAREPGAALGQSWVRRLWKGR